MQLVQLIDEELIQLQLGGERKAEVISEMIDLLHQAGALADRNAFAQAIEAREAQGHTGIGFGIAIPHGKSDAVRTPRVAVGIKPSGLKWDGQDEEDVKIVFMIAVPESQAGNEHLKILQLLAVKLIDETFRAQLLAATNKEEVLQLLADV
ncbi:PTS sugar transporter subunit IIA [Laceyella putida]|uniref:PTS sugar transporter subunit IIA n=1 Tax=Laceyella putida TaxID=110101 RepID=A0ABW2RMZ7_9BACL